MSEGGYPPYDDEQRQPNRVLGIVLLIVAVVGGAIAILTGSLVIGAFFSYLVPLTTGLPAHPAAIIASIPGTAFIAYFIFVGGIVIIAVAGILKIIFGFPG